jgi:hypothetical protein
MTSSTTTVAAAASDPLRGLARMLEQASEEALRRIGVTLLVHEDVPTCPCSSTARHR